MSRGVPRMRFSFLRGATSSRLRRGLTAASALVLGTGIVVVAATQANAATGCSVTYTVTNQWPTGFGANINITNLGDPLTSWTLTFSFSAGQGISQLWNGTVSQSGSNVTVTNASDTRTRA